MLEKYFFDMLSALVVAGGMLYLRKFSNDRDKQEKTDRKNLVLNIEKKISKVQADLTTEIRGSYDSIIKAVNAEYVRKEQFGPLRKNVEQLERMVADHGTRITRIEAQRET